MKKLLLGVVTFHLALVPCFADVIPTRRGQSDTASEQKIKARLESLGMSAADADRQVRDLSPADATYFAQDVNRVQYAAGLYWYEWVGGLVLLVALTVFIIIKA
ncbi:MAG TPA: hypothetical protein VG457_16600 [Planctomycetota bacterium]|jgi:hypothetical protein|nr:hypothetical protein [Planctomycetota bacterium]